MADEVEDRSGPGAHSEAREHVRQLAHRGVGEHLLDVVLRQGDGRREDGREDADAGHHEHRDRRVGKDRVGAGDHVDPSVDHGRSVDEGADRGRALHRIGQPDVERKLGGLADRSCEEQQRDNRDRELGRGLAAKWD